jgi:hypothetical protein
LGQAITGTGLAAAVAAALVVVGCAAPDGSAPVAVRPGSTPARTAPQAQPPATTGAPVGGVPTADAFAGSPLIDRAEWTDDSDGRRLHVYPTPAGRADTYPPALDRAWHEVLTFARDAGTPGMYDQFTCHWEWARVVAPNKPSWNLEPWRPAVGYEATVQALCNPGGPDPAGN